MEKFPEYFERNYGAAQSFRKYIYSLCWRGEFQRLVSSNKAQEIIEIKNC